MKTSLQRSPDTRNANCLGTKFWKPSAAVWLAVLLTHLGLASAQTLAKLDIQLYAGLSITGAVGTVCSIEYVTDLAQTNNGSAWGCLEFLQLPATNHLWFDRTVPATGKCIYRVVALPRS